MYSFEISMENGNGSNHTSLLVVAPQIIEELEMGFVPQKPRPLAIELFGDQRIFINAPQYHWHIQGAGNANEEAR